MSVSRPSNLRPPAGQTIRLSLAVALVYAALAEATFQLMPSGTPAFFPAAGLTAAVLGLTSPRRWPWLLLAIGVSELVVDVANGVAFPPAVAFAGANMIEPLVAATILRRWCNGACRLNHPRQVVGLALSAVAAPLVSGVLGAAAAASLTDGSSLASTYSQWWSGDMVGILLIAPLVFAATGSVKSLRSRPRTVELFALVTVIVASAILGFGLTNYAFAFLVVPPVLWAGLRFGPRGASGAIAVVSVIAVALAGAEAGPFMHAESSVAEAMRVLQIFLAVTALCALLLGAVSQQKDAVQASVASSERSLQAMFDASPLPTIQMTADSGVVMRWNAAAEAMFGWSADEVVGEFVPFLSEAERDRFPQSLLQLIAGGDANAVETTKIRRDGSDVAVLSSASVVVDGDRRVTLVVVLQDISERKEIEARLVHAAGHDALTGLPNRLLLQDRLERALTRQLRQGGLVASFFVDVDHFKIVNDSMGHEIGDVLLQHVARRLQAAAREVDTVARFGGDEFVIITEGLADRDIAVVIAERIRDYVAAPLDVGGHNVPLSCSIGISLAEDPGTTVEQMLRWADSAMYEAKGRGRNCFALWTADGLQEINQTIVDPWLSLPGLPDLAPVNFNDDVSVGFFAFDD